MKGQHALSATRRALQENADFLAFTVLVLGIIISLLATGVIDQGLMGVRLTAFSGTMLGALAAAWNIYQARLPVSEPEGAVSTAKAPVKRAEVGRGMRRVPAGAGSTTS
jgi:hypothetical protein